MDKSLTYIVGAIAPHGVMDRIKVGQPCGIRHDERWVHVGALFFEGKSWRYIDADLHKGVAEADWNDEVSACAVEGIRHECFPFAFCVSCLRGYLGVPFGKKQLQALERDDVMLPIVGEEGIHCGELLALCAELSPFTSAWKVRSVDWQALGKRLGIEEVGLL